jgi:SMC interacting uncharacterized protein involved in chromosome segregation
MTDKKEPIDVFIESLPRYGAECSRAQIAKLVLHEIETQEELSASRDRIDKLERRVAELEKIMKEMIAAIDKCFTPDDLACERLANRARRLLDD